MNPSHTLVQGKEPLEKFNAILAETSIRSEDVIGAMRKHFIEVKSNDDGWPAPMCYMLFGISQQQFNRGVTAMNKAYRKIESDVVDNISKAAL